MLYIGMAKIFAGTLSIEWLFKGMEDFQYITLRSLIIKTCYVVSVFVFVKCPEDYVVYFFLTMLMAVVGAIVNITYSFKSVKFVFRQLEIGKFLKSNVTLGFFTILTSMYTTFNITYLGFITDTKQVGYYATATKLYSILFGVFSALVKETIYEKYH